MKIYLDANVFILAALAHDAQAGKAKEYIKRVILGEFDGFTSSLTVDEVVWSIWKETKNRILAIEEGDKLLQFNNLRILAVDEKIMSLSLRFMHRYGHLKPRDAIHVAAAYDNGVFTIITEDADFERIKEIKRIAITL